MTSHYPLSFPVEQVIEIVPYVLLREGEQKEFTFSEVEFIF